MQSSPNLQFWQVNHSMLKAAALDVCAFHNLQGVWHMGKIPLANHRASRSGGSVAAEEDLQVAVPRSSNGQQADENNVVQYSTCYSRIALRGLSP